MKYCRFTINNYKAIKNLTVNLSSNVIPIIGINESGKTSILQAILAFDRDKDNLLNGAHVAPKNKYKTVQEVCTLKADFKINDNDFNLIGEEIKLHMDSPLYSWLKQTIEEDQTIALKRICEGEEFLREYTLCHPDKEISTDPKLRALIRALVKRLPNILYFDDFTDRVPEFVEFPVGYKGTGSLGRSRNREWLEIITEIFSRSSEVGYTLERFLELEDEDDRENVLRDVAQTLNREIIDEWDKLKSTHSSFDDGDNNLQLEIKYNSMGGKPTFKFKVIDCESQDSSRVFNITQRSKGFQWFFNFIVKLKFNPKYKLFPENAIYLLDEPGSYLHSSAQVELLKKLCDIGMKNTIIYCTHSQYLLDPDVINISSIKIAEKTEGNISLTNYGKYKAPRNMGAFAPINDALRLKLQLFGPFPNKCLLVEGITDYYFFNLFGGFNDLSIIPGTGCGQLRDLISMLISFCTHYLILLDNDNQARESFKQYGDFFGASFIDRVYQYEGVSNNGDFKLEDILSDDDKKKLMDLTNCNDVKGAITLFYFNKNAHTSLEFTPETKKRLGIIKKNISSFFRESK